MLILLRLTIEYTFRRRAINVAYVNELPLKTKTRVISIKNVIKYSALALLFFLVLVCLEGIALGTGTYYYLRAGLPIPSEESMAAMPESTKIYDRNGEFLYEVHGEVKRRFVPLSEIPIYLQEATIAIEDKNFYKHYCFDPIAILRAAYINYRNGEISQGASTITQQLARTLFLNNEQDYLRKINELILAIEIEKRFSKDEILEMYLNNIPYGSVAYGVSAASEIYLNKPVNKVNFIEAAHIAALPKAPSNYSPFGSGRFALEQRAKQVLLAMKDANIITEAEYNYAIEENAPEFVDSPTPIKAPHFVFYVLDELNKEYGENRVKNGGLDIITTLDLNMQEKAEEIVSEWGNINEEKWGAKNASLVAIDPSTGEILAMVGSRDYFEPDFGAFNVAISPRQPGSSFKPYVYATAISQGLSPDDYVVDSRTNFAEYNYGVEYIPRNYDGKFRGLISIRKALAGSLNVPAVKIIVKAGIDKTIDMAESLGISTLGDRNRFGPSLALGGGEVKLLEHTSAFGVFANGGEKAPLSSILRVENGLEKPIYERNLVDDERTAYLMNDMLSDASAREYIFGRNSKLEIPGHRVAAKTGTTQDFHDAWTVGYTPSIAVGVWSGNNDNTEMKEGANGYVVATPIWREFMTYALSKVAKKDFVVPSNLEFRNIENMENEIVKNKQVIELNIESMTN